MAHDNANTAVERDLPGATLPPQSPLPPPDDNWLQQAGNVVGEPPPVSPGFTGRQQRFQDKAHTAAGTKRQGLFNRSSTLKAITATGVVGIAVLALLEFKVAPSSLTDMLGTELVKLVPESAPLSRANQTPIDPRLADPVALDMLQLENAPQITKANALTTAPELTTQGLPTTELPAHTAAPSSMQADTSVKHQPSTTPAPASAAPEVTNEELMLRLERLELLLAQLQLQAKANAATPPLATTAPTATTAPSAAVVAPAPAQRRTELTSRPAPARMVKAKPSRPLKQAKAPATAPAPALGGQLVSVDMWNGEASVVIASGLPGDRRVRVLRPGDVVNGMALRTADPVTRSATFVAPGSQGLTLYVSQGG